MAENEKEEILDVEPLPEGPEGEETVVVAREVVTREASPAEVAAIDAAVEPADGEVAEAYVFPMPTDDILLRRPRRVYGGSWGHLEIAAVVAGLVAIVSALLLYLLFVIPSNRELAKNRSEAERLEAEKMSADSKYGEITDTKTQVAKLLASVDDFETRFLPAAVNGRSALYQRLNGLIGGYGLVNTTGPDYQPLETIDQSAGNQSDEERGRAKYRSLFPGVYVTMTVEGSYQNLRRFIRDIETSNDFVVISTIELEPSDSEAPKDNTRPPAGGQLAGNPAGIPPGTRVNPGFVQTQPALTSAAQKGKTHGQVVALHLEMAAYFRRANYAPISDGTAAQ